MSEIIEKEEQMLSKEEFREKIMKIQDTMMDRDDCWTGDKLDEHCPLKHSYGDGLYVREIFMPKGTIIISKLHKKTHPYFVLKGKAFVATENGVVLIEAPYQGMTQAGTKRALYIHEDMTWITVHATDKTDLKEIEEEIISKNYEEFDLISKEVESCHGD